jgi:hypothetical protein
MAQNDWIVFRKKRLFDVFWGEGDTAHLEDVSGIFGSENRTSEVFGKKRVDGRWVFLFSLQKTAGQDF